MTPTSRGRAPWTRTGSRRPVDLVDDTFVRAAPAAVAAAIADPLNQRLWWPHLRLDVVQDRGDLGQRWTVDGQLQGSMEIWVEPFSDGVIVHHYVRAWRTAHTPRDVATRHTRRWKRAVHALKDRLEDRTL